MSCGVVMHGIVNSIARQFGTSEELVEKLLREALDTQLGLKNSRFSDWEVADIREDALHHMIQVDFYPEDLWETELGELLPELPCYALREDILLDPDRGGFLAWFLESIPRNAAMELRELAQDKIIQGFNNALSSGGEYPLGVLCSVCSEEIIEKNAAKTGAKIEKKRSIVDGTISNIVLRPANHSPVIIVIDYDIELSIETYIPFEESGFPVLICQVFLGDVAELDRRFTATSYFNLPSFTCQDCKRRKATQYYEHI